MSPRSTRRDGTAGLDYLQNATAELPGSRIGNATVQVDILAGGNVMTI